jgi:hypothetical protein
MASVENYQAPQVEDYDSEESEVIRSNFPRKSSPTAQANVSTKRSKDLNAEQAPLLEKMPTNIDLRSDSGYSSYTAASKSSADSAPSATSRSPPVLPASTAPAVSQSPAPPKQTAQQREQPPPEAQVHLAHCFRLVQATTPCCWPASSNYHPGPTRKQRGRGMQRPQLHFLPTRQSPSSPSPT